MYISTQKINKIKPHTKMHEILPVSSEFSYFEIVTC